MITLSYDKIGFPMATVPKVGAFHLWPVTKMQFVQYMMNSDRYGSEWYNNLLSLNPAVSIEECTIENVERLFITGILPHEALDFAKWLGNDYDLPTEEEWKSFYNAVRKQLFPFRLSPYGVDESVVNLGKWLSSFLQNPLSYSFLEDGILEWARGEKGYVGRGAPRISFYPNVWDPATDSIRVINCNERVYYFGFRLIKRANHLKPIEAKNDPY